MESTILKQNFHKLIDKFDNNEVLEDFYEAIQDYSEKRNVDIVDEITDEQRKRLFQSIEQSEQGQTISHEKALSEIRQWFTK